MADPQPYRLASLLSSWRLALRRTPAQRVARRDTPASPLAWRDTLYSRLLVFAVVLAVWAVAIMGRLVFLTVVNRADLLDQAERQQTRTRVLPGKRGDIYDRNGRLLAYSVDAETIAANPMAIEDPATTAAAVCGALRQCDAREVAERLRSLQRQRKSFGFIARRVGPVDAARVKALELPGIAVFRESRRYYPNMELAASVLGYVGLENHGLDGIEATYDRRIRGRDGKIIVQADGRQRPLEVQGYWLPTAGDSLELTIDQQLQHIAERELRAGIAENRAAGGTVVIMSPHTGEILADASWPTFNPNAFEESPAEHRRNRAVQDSYEPGSTFKVVTASAALEEGVISPDTPVDCAPGFITLPGRPPIRDVHAYGVLPFTDVIVKSSNVGAIRVGLRLGAERISRYVNRFGFGQAISPDFPGEHPGQVWNPAKLDTSGLASVSMGYQIAVTPLQMAAAVSAVANGGTLLEPRVVRAFIHEGQREEVPHKALRTAISQETAATLTTMMEAVVERGTAKAAQIGGYTIAGKTGTASKIVDRRYSRTEYFASFAGFVPSRKPEFTIVVVIDTPRTKGYYGGTVAAPIFRRIAEAALLHRGIPPTLNPPPPVLVASLEAQAQAPRLALGDQDTLVRALAAIDSDVVPDVRGLGARDAVRALAQAGLHPRVTGRGVVIEQTPEPGSPLAPGATATLTLGRLQPAAPTGGQQ